jgi:hypothetical protein
MLSREEAVQRLRKIERELAELRRSLDLGASWGDGPQATRAFLARCGGWEDTRTPEKLIAEIYASRTASQRGTDLFAEGN